ncbi:Pectinesterase [compost metagenome]
MKREGWHNWNKTDAEQTVQYAEYNSAGPGAGRAADRVAWAKMLTEQEAAEYAIPLILSGMDGWQPFEGEGEQR